MYMLRPTSKWNCSSRCGCIVEVDGRLKSDEVKFSFSNLCNRFIWIEEAWILRTLTVCLDRISNSPV